jgi:hypothetical protein
MSLSFFKVFVVFTLYSKPSKANKKITHLVVLFGFILYVRNEEEEVVVLQFLSEEDFMKQEERKN